MSTSATLEGLLGRPRGRAVTSAVSAWQRFRRGEPLAILPHLFMR